MVKRIILSVCFGIYFFWMSVLVDANQMSTVHQKGSDSSPAVLILLGSGLCFLSFLGKRPESEK